MSKEIAQLKEGYKKFHQKYFNDKNKTFDNLIRRGQQPKILIISCCDSRVDPSIILGCEPGDLLVVRNVANLVPPFENFSSYHGTSAAIEFGVTGLGVQDIIILGHSYCGGIRALVEDAETVKKEGYVSKWMELAAPAREQTMQSHPDYTLDQQADECAHYALINSLNNLMTFPWLKERVESNQLDLHAWYFDLSTGLIDVLNQETNVFEMMEV